MPYLIFAQDGTPLWGKAAINGPGVWVSCVKGKEKQAVGELYDVFESVKNLVFIPIGTLIDRGIKVAADLWPSSSKRIDSNDNVNEEDASDEFEGLSIEEQIAKEVASLKRPRKENRFGVHNFFLELFIRILLADTKS